VVKLFVVLQQYSTFTQQRVTQPLEIRDRPRHCHCLSYSFSSTYRTEDRIVSATALTVLDLQRQYDSTFAASATPICLGNSVRSTGSTETVSATVPTVPPSQPSHRPKRPTVPSVRRPLLQVFQQRLQHSHSTGPTEAVLSAATTVVLDSTRLQCLKQAF
jgi:hypothetical protein